MSMKNDEEIEAFKNRLKKIVSEPTVSEDMQLVELLKSAIKRLGKKESVQVVASNLSRQIKSNFAEKDLPKAVIDLQLKLEKYVAIGANGLVSGVFDW